MNKIDNTMKRLKFLINFASTTKMMPNARVMYGKMEGYIFEFECIRIIKKAPNMMVSQPIPFIIVFKNNIRLFRYISFCKLP